MLHDCLCRHNKSIIVVCFWIGRTCARKQFKKMRPAENARRKQPPGENTRRIHQTLWKDTVNPKMHKPLSYQLRPQPFELGLGVWGSVLHEEVALRLAAMRAEGWRQVEAARAGEAKARVARVEASVETLSSQAKKLESILKENMASAAERSASEAAAKFEGRGESLQESAADLEAMFEDPLEKKFRDLEGR